jgi:hypothetical protein
MPPFIGLSRGRGGIGRRAGLPEHLFGDARAFWKPEDWGFEAPRPNPPIVTVTMPDVSRL